MAKNTFASYKSYYAPLGEDKYNLLPSPRHRTMQRGMIALCISNVQGGWIDCRWKSIGTVSLKPKGCENFIEKKDIKPKQKKK